MERMVTGDNSGDRNMNFKVIDGDDSYLDKLPVFVEEYNRGYFSVEKLIEVLGVTRNEYRKLRRYALEEDLIQLRRKPNKKKRTYKTHPKHYSPNNRGKYHYFNIYKNNEYYCSCKTREQAEKIVEGLERVNWDKRHLNRIKEEVM